MLELSHTRIMHLTIVNLRKNTQKAEQGTNPETLKRDKQTQKHLHISQ